MTVTENTAGAWMQQQLQTNGYIILKDVVSADSLGKLRDDLTAIFASVARPGETVFETIRRLDAEDSQTLYRIYQFVSRTFTSMDAVRADILPVVEDILPDGIVIDLGSAIIFGIPENSRLTWQWHQEGPYAPAIPNILSVNMPVFEPARRENGSISLLKGSHRLGVLPYDKIQEAPDASTSLVPRGIDRLVEEYEEACFEAEPGDIILFYESLIHRSNINQSDRPRVTFVGRFTSIQSLPEHATLIDGKPY